MPLKPPGLLTEEWSSAPRLAPRQRRHRRQITAFNGSQAPPSEESVDEEEPTDDEDEDAGVSAGHLRAWRERSYMAELREASEILDAALERRLPLPPTMSSMFPSFLDNGVQASRNPPNLQQQQAQQSNSQAQQNGIGGPLAMNGAGGNMNGAGAGAGAGAGGAANGGAFVPTAAGHQSDLNFLWEQLDQLSTVLRENRAQVEGVVGQAVDAATRIQSNGEGNGEVDADTQEAHIALLAAEVLKLRKQYDRKENEQNTTRETLDYSLAVVGKMAELVRNFSYSNTMHIMSIHRHYQNLLNKEREANMELRNEHAEWQGRLGGVAQNVRMALRHVSDVEDQAWIHELKAENRILKKHIGLPVEPEEDE